MGQVPIDSWLSPTTFSRTYIFRIMLFQKCLSKKQFSKTIISKKLSNDHNSSVRWAPDLILGAPYTSRPCRSSWDRSRSIPGCPGRLFDENTVFFQKKIFLIFSVTGQLAKSGKSGVLTDPPRLSQKVRDLRTSPRDDFSRRCPWC